uniref:Uncharacterized protein n=1 Tax=Nelumbo nucifera TaxID=4432 RepID=A0A822XGL8_NELNU|nr:TPA_asm: hypothetical protein HUJ06_019714 [Nelumbo nucifera]
MEDTGLEVHDLALARMEENIVEVEPIVVVDSIDLFEDRGEDPLQKSVQVGRGREGETRKANGSPDQMKNFKGKTPNLLL